MISNQNDTSITIDPDECTCLLYNHQRKRSKWQLFINTQFASLLPSITLGIILWFGITPSEELSPTAIHLLAVFISCIFALMTTSFSLTTLVMTALVILSLTQSFQCIDHTTGESIECRLCGTPNTALLDKPDFDCLGAQEAFAHSLEGFSSTVVWLIFAAFHLGKAVEVTGLGKRLSLWLVQTFGKHILGLAYSIVFSELFIAPFVPSNTARGGGIIMPVVYSIAKTLGSTPLQNPEIGGFLMLLGSHANLLSASMYLTGMAPNPIVLAKANQLFPKLNFTFMTWLSGSMVPALLCAFCLPLILKRLMISSGPRSKQTFNSEIVVHARKELSNMGSMTRKEKELCFVLISCLCLWVTAGYTQLDSTLVALIGIVALLHMGTITWKDVSTNTTAWDTLFWLGGFITIAQHLSNAGASTYLGDHISATITDLGLPPVPCLALAYFLTTFLFSSLSAHTVAFASTFLEAGHALGANPMILTALLAYFGALGGCMTNFSTGTAAMYYAPGYVSRSKWFGVGTILALFYIIIYFTIGMGWWKLLGWY
ncbi:Sodium/sulfate symporter [Halteromyces radiatus]|uniref:Sodium/sulfate symporter n=1 Tax=Halteromyces radiatus TaxID=101107 RepID=UPI00221F625F|nr:Sodium/sulfate symporter [Halteromyces radiatus]KAI8097065.1 Sodium/sulfate symporter [Halteromyces radiatus]